ncbi:MAG TPA: hypothetical protein VKP30_16535 [Polyangiaceae bacterium]|nr:hypothetical protein [Polyangiaceae bacterium]
MVSLPEQGRTGDVATLPLGTTEKRPVVVAVHGAGDRPNWACGGWRIALEAYAFVACPSGLPMSHQTFGWINTQGIQNA